MLAPFLFWKARVIKSFFLVIKTTEETAAEGESADGEKIFGQTENLFVRICIVFLKMISQLAIVFI